MIRTFSIKAFKSVVDLELELGRVNVFIGENGCGKSNILEAMALAGAAAARKLDHEFLAARGIRLPEPRFLLSAFPSSQENILTELRPGMEVAWEEASDIRERLVISPRTDSPYPWLLPIWVDDGGASSELSPPDLEQRLMDFVEGPSTPSPQREKERALIQSGIRRYMRMQRSSLRSFLIYSPENTSLRTFQREGQILPLGVQGEGLFKLLRVLSATTETEPWRDVTQNLGLLDWFGSVEVAPDDPAVEHKLRIRDRYLEGDLSTFDERSANEGFLFLLFYFALVVSPDTPKFFAIDNIDASLNPKTCQELMRRLSQLAVKYDKQIIATTHNPAVLDGLDLNDDEQRLFVVRRNRKGHTIAKRVPPPRPVGDALPPRLSEAFMRGLLGGLPQNF